MSKDKLRRHSSVPAYIFNEENAVEIEENDLRWRRGSHAAITSMLPSYSAMHSDEGLTFNRKITAAQRRRSSANWRKSITAVSGLTSTAESQRPKSLANWHKSFSTLTDMNRKNVEFGLPECSQSAPDRKQMQCLSVLDTWKMRMEEREKTVQSIKSMAATIAVKKKYR